MEAQRMKIVYAVHSRDGRQSSSRIGVAFVAADGSMNVKLDAIPLSGELEIRNYAPRAEAREGMACGAPATRAACPLERARIDPLEPLTPLWPGV